MKIHRYGDHALLLDVAAGTAATWAASARHELPGVVDVVPAEQSLLVTFANTQARAAAEERIATLHLDRSSQETTPTLTIDVDYEGPDLAEVAEATGLSTADVVELHCGTTYRVAFFGFAPGFPYLTGLDQRLQLPRRSRPRTQVPTGAVAIAAHYSAVYPRPSPGGWHLIGQTDTVLFDITRQQPTPLELGMTVRFRAR